MNLVDLIKGHIGADTLSQLGSTLGTGTDQTRAAVDAAVPSVLAGLSHLASTPQGAQRLDSALGALDERAPVNTDAGGGILGSLLGGMHSNLAGALGKFSGLSTGSITAMLAMIGPMILGALKRQKESLGLDAGGVANLLSQQKQNIASAIPSGLSNALGSIPGIGGILGAAKSAVGGAAGSAARATEDAARSVGNEARYVGSEARNAIGAVAPHRSVLPWAIGALAVLALALILWKAVTSSTPSAPVAQAPPAPTVGQKMANLADALPAGAQLPADPLAAATTKINDSIKSATDTFSSITDSASADTALPKLRDFSTQLDSIQSLTDKLTASGKSQVSSLLKPMVDKLNPLIDKAMALPGVSNKISPVVNDIRTKLNSLTATPA
jgi:hypothetical protein